MDKLIIVLLLSAVGGCSSAPTAREDAYGEAVLPGEAALDREISDLSVATLKKEHGASQGPMPRDVHAKAHGCVRGKFTVDADVPPEYRAGVFAEPGKGFPAWIRFSNGGAKVQPDGKADARGMAIKLMGVEGEKLLENEKQAKTQDFLLITHDAFFVKNGEDYADFFRRVARGSNPAWFFFGRLPWRWTEFKAAYQLVKRGGRMTDPLFAPYFSATPYLLGERNVVKYAVRPCAPDPDPRDRFAGSPDSLRLNMASSLSAEKGAPACFKFMVQRRADPATMPVEDSRIPWDQRKSAFVPVATIVVPVQEFSSAGQMRFCEDLSFTPWHSLPAHRPLGNINRTRKAVYEAVSAFRHESNREVRREPDVAERPE